jgi:hypothetical protein
MQTTPGGRNEAVTAGTGGSTFYRAIPCCRGQVGLCTIGEARGGGGVNCSWGQQ